MTQDRSAEDRSLRALLPEVAPGAGVATAAPIVLAMGRAGPDPRTLSRRGSPVFVMAPGVLQTPRFHARVPWISGVIAHIWRDGVVEPGPAPEPPGDRAHALAGWQDRVVAEQLGGTFWADPPPEQTLRSARVLVRAGRDRAAATGLLEAALAEGDAGAIVFSQQHPDRALTARATRHGCTILSGDFDPWPLLARIRTLHAAGHDPLAGLAEMAGVRVAGAGGHHPLLAARYADPFTGRPFDCGAALDVVAEWRRVTRANRGIGALTGMSFWKRERMASFFHDGVQTPRHCRTAAAAVAAAGTRGVAAWSSRMPAGLMARAAAAGTPVLRVEDGFVRSFGLGSGFLPPGSVIADASGIYYDPARPSDLETLLRETQFDPALLARARGLMQRLVREGVTKYGAGGDPVQLPDTGGRTRVLVPGQVADDLSVRLGGAGVAGNADLLARVRAANPDAFVIYKPHPDVDAGHRAGVVPLAELQRHADLVVRGVPMAAVIAAVDEVHTLTSLAGYEALLRGRRVVVHGQPFYAGWGLTHDIAPPPRRGRQLTLEELSAGVLLLYARYVDPVTELPCPAEVLLDRLANQTAWRETGLMRLRRLQGMLRARLAR